MLNLPIFNGNWIDLAILGFWLFFIWEGWGRGFISQLVELLVLILAIVLALLTYPVLSNILVTDFSFALSLANSGSLFVLAVVYSQILVNLPEKLQGKIPQQTHMSKLNRRLEILPQIGSLLVLTEFGIVLILGLPIYVSIKNVVSASIIARRFYLSGHSIEKELNRRLNIGSDNTLNFNTVVPESQTMVDLKFTQMETSVAEADEKFLQEKINDFRAGLGLSKLEFNDNLQIVAREFAKSLFMRGILSQSPDGETTYQRIEKSGLVFDERGESIVLSPNAELVILGLIDTPGHKEYLMSGDFHKFGVGAIDGGVFGRIYIVEFTD